MIYLDKYLEGNLIKFVDGIRLRKEVTWTLEIKCMLETIKYKLAFYKSRNKDLKLLMTYPVVRANTN